MSDQVHLRILETTDLHVNVFPYDDDADKPNDTFGLARTATLIDSLRAEAANTLLIDSGDLIQGSPMGNDVASVPGTGVTCESGPSARAHLGDVKGLRVSARPATASSGFASTCDGRASQSSSSPRACA